MNQLCRTCHKPAKMIDSRAVDKNTTRRRYCCQNAQCADRWSTIELVIDDKIKYPEIRRALANAGRVNSVLATIKDIAEGAL